MQIGFIGLGTMGACMARNLLREGFTLTVHNRTRDKEVPLSGLGAGRAATPGEAAAGADVVITVVSDTPDVEEVLFGSVGVAGGARPGTTVVDMSTIDPAATAAFAERLAGLGVRMLDAPVSGGPEGAEAGTLSIMVGGQQGAFESVLPVFEAMGRTITYIGPSGTGQMAKAINQVVVAGTYLGVAEGMALGMRAGLEMERVLQALSGGAATSWTLTNRAPRMLAGEFPAGFRVTLHRKDLGIALQAAARAGTQLPGAQLVAQLEDALIAAGLGDADISAIVRAVLDRR